MLRTRLLSCFPSSMAVCCSSPNCDQRIPRGQSVGNAVGARGLANVTLPIFQDQKCLLPMKRTLWIQASKCQITQNYLCLFCKQIKRDTTTQSPFIENGCPCSCTATHYVEVHLQEPTTNHLCFSPHEKVSCFGFFFLMDHY